MPQGDTKDYTIEIPGWGKKTVGRWLYSCHPPNSVFVPALGFGGGLDIEITLDKLKNCAGALGKLFGDKELTDFINNAKELVPSGKLGIKVEFEPEVHAIPCPNDSEYASLVFFTLRLVIIGNVAGTYGIVKGKAYVHVEIELVGDQVWCDCPKVKEKAVLEQKKLSGSSNAVLVGGPALPGAAVAMPENGSDSDQTEEDADITPDEPADTDQSDEGGQEAVIERVDPNTGESEVIKRIPLQPTSKTL